MKYGIYLKITTEAEEISWTTKQLPKNKASGPDGLTPDFYKVMLTDIAKTLGKAYDTMWEGGPYLPSETEVYIKHLPKPGKDVLMPAS